MMGQIAMRTSIRILISLWLALGAPAQQGFFGSNGSTAPAIPQIYWGVGCAGTSSQTCSIGDTNQSALQVSAVGTSSFTTGSNTLGYTVQACGVYITAVDGTNKGLTCAIYDDTGFPGVTNAICTATSGITLSGTGWVENNHFTGCHLAPNKLYVNLVEVEGSGTQLTYLVAGGTDTLGYLTGITYPVWPGTGDGYFWNPGTAHSGYARMTAD